MFDQRLFPIGSLTRVQSNGSESFGISRQQLVTIALVRSNCLINFIHGITRPQQQKRLISTHHYFFKLQCFFTASITSQVMFIPFGKTTKSPPPISKDPTDPSTVTLTFPSSRYIVSSSLKDHGILVGPPSHLFNVQSLVSKIV